MLIFSAIISAGSLLGYTFAPAWAALVLCSLVLGLGSGILDGGMNIHFAANFGPRQMNWLHACFGVGATLAPLAMTAILNAGARGGGATAWPCSVMCCWRSCLR